MTHDYDQSADLREPRLQGTLVKDKLLGCSSAWLVRSQGGHRLELHTSTSSLHFSFVMGQSRSGLGSLDDLALQWVTITSGSCSVCVSDPVS